MKKLFLPVLFLYSFLLHAQPESLRTFDAYRGGVSSWMKYQNLDNAWYNHLHQIADQHLDRRDAEVQACENLQTWGPRKKILKENLLQSIGGLPEKTPLRAQTLATLERPSFTVEKVIYESLPQFHVTACLFIPKNLTKPAPAVIYCSGHAREAFRSPTYQRVIINLVEKGFIVLAFDPIGQGERYQYLDENGQPNLGGPTKEHSYAGLQCLLWGESIARYMIHDGIRAVDYLLSRKEVDPQRIGITGRSGGGTQSASIAAFDDRIYAVAPENYITSFRRIWDAIGPQDAEQDFPSAHILGIDHGDLLSIRAPKPAMMLTTTRDYFSIQGARETFREVQQIYQYYEAEDQFDFTEDDHQHGSTAANREAMNAFFQRALSQPGDPSDHEVELFSFEELLITQTGQVISALNSRTVFDLNQEKVSTISKISTDQSDNNMLKAKIRKTTRIQSPTIRQAAVFTGRIQRADYSIEKYFLEFDDNHYPIPFLLVSQTSNEPRPLILYLRSDGKEKEMQPGGEIEQLVRAGYTVLAPDLLNAGELSTNAFQGDSQINNISFNLVFGSSLVGKSLIALQTEDLMSLVKFMKNDLKVNPDKISAIADGGYCASLMHYMALNSPFAKIVLRQPLASWLDLLQQERYLPAFAHSIVPGALSHYDLPKLLILGFPQKLRLIAPQNALGLPLSIEEANALYKELKDKKTNEQFSLILKEEEDIQGMLKWLEE